MAQTGTSGFGSGPTLPMECSPGDIFASTNPPSLSLGIANDHWATIVNVIGEVSATTTNNTPTTVFSFPVASSRALLFTAEFIATRNDFASGCGGTVTAIILRGTTGNISRSGAQMKAIAGGMSATVDLDANASTQTVDVNIKGEGTQTNVWRVRLYAYNYRSCAGSLP